MTANTIILLHQAAAFDDLLHTQSLVRQILLADFSLTETAEQNAQCLDVFIRQIELRHHLLDPFGRVNSRCLELTISPVVPSLLDIGAVAEEQFFFCLRTKRRELGAYARLLFHALDLVAAEATPLAHERFAFFDTSGIGEFFLNPRYGVAL